MGSSSNMYDKADNLVTLIKNQDRDRQVKTKVVMAEVHKLDERAMIKEKDARVRQNQGVSEKVD